MPNKSQSILLAGAAIGVSAVMSGLIPTVGDCIACILFIGAGVVAVWHYTDRHQLTLKGGQGLSLGALAGLVAAAVQTILDRLMIGIGLKPSWQEEMQRGFRESGMDPAQIDQFEQWFSSPWAYLGLVVIGLIVAAIAGGVGGAIGANIFKNDAEFFDDEASAEGSPEGTSNMP